MIRILQKEVSLQWLQTLNVPLMSSSSNHLMSSLAFWTSPVTQLVKNLPAVWETWVRSLGWEDPLEKGKATHSSILARRIPYSPWGCKESDTTEQLSLHFTSLHLILVGMR